jgi:hypothetical protein
VRFFERRGSVIGHVYGRFLKGRNGRPSAAGMSAKIGWVHSQEISRELPVLASGVFSRWLSVSVRDEVTTSRYQGTDCISLHGLFWMLLGIRLDHPGPR